MVDLNKSKPNFKNLQIQRKHISIFRDSESDQTNPDLFTKVSRLFTRENRTHSKLKVTLPEQNISSEETTAEQRVSYCTKLIKFVKSDKRELIPVMNSSLVESESIKKPRRMQINLKSNYKKRNVNKDKKQHLKAIHEYYQYENFDANDMQLAIALSSSEVEYKNLDGHEDHSNSNGIKKANGARSFYEKGLINFKNTNKLKWAKKFSPLTLRNFQAQNRKISIKIEHFLVQQLTKISLRNMEEYSNNSTLYSCVLKSSQAKSSDKIIKNTEIECWENYFVTDLFGVNYNRCDKLLKNWNKIKGRDFSYEMKKANKLTQKKNDTIFSKMELSKSQDRGLRSIKSYNCIKNEKNPKFLLNDTYVINNQIPRNNSPDIFGDSLSNIEDQSEIKINNDLLPNYDSNKTCNTNENLTETVLLSSPRVLRMLDNLPLNQWSENFQLNGKSYKLRKSNKSKPLFEKFTDTELLKQLYNNGVKPLHRKAAIKILEHIYNQTHPTIIYKKTEKESPKENTYSIEASHNLLDVITKPNFELDVHKTPNESYIFNCTLKKFYQLPVPLHIAWYNLTNFNEGLHEAVIMQKPIKLHEVYAFFKTIGLRYNFNDLRSFFDKRSILFF